MKALNYEILKSEVIGALENNMAIVLATCSNNRVTAREVYYASNDLHIYFLTSKAYEKYKQIEKNNNVALCLNNIQIEGVANIKGHPNLQENKNQLNICFNKNKEIFERFTKYRNTVLIEVVVSCVELWKNNGREYLEVIKEEAYRVG